VRQVGFYYTEEYNFFFSYDSQYKKLFCPKTGLEPEDLRRYYPLWEPETDWYPGRSLL